MRVERVRPEFVEEFPTLMEPGVLYVSIEYNTCGHLCVCGCGNEVMTPLSPVQWALTYDGRDVSLRPSVGSWALPCRSHYVLDRGRVRWARALTDAEIDRNRVRDRRALANASAPEGERSGDHVAAEYDLHSDDPDDAGAQQGAGAGVADGVPAPEPDGRWWRRLTARLRSG